MRSAGLDEAQAGIKIARRNINTLSILGQCFLKCTVETLTIRVDVDSGEDEPFPSFIRSESLVGDMPPTISQCTLETFSMGQDYVFNM